MALLCGEGSIEALEKFSKTLQSITKIEAERKLNRTFQSYQPWMSHTLHLVEFAGEFFPSDQVEKSEPVVVAGSDLDRLAKTYQDPEIGLAKLDPKALSFAIAPTEREEATELRHLLEKIFLFNQMHCPSSWSKIKALVNQVIPLVARDPNTLPTRRDGSGFSNHYLRGAIFLSLPRISETRFFELALNLIHECGHQALMVYQCSDDILAEDLNAPVYSVIRKTDRPAILSFHAAVATAFMIEWIIEAKDRFEDLVPKNVFLARWTQLINDLDDSVALFTGRKFTPLGKLIFDDLRCLSSRARVLEFGKKA